MTSLGSEEVEPGQQGYITGGVSLGLQLPQPLSAFALSASCLLKMSSCPSLQPSVAMVSCQAHRVE